MTPSGRDTFLLDHSLDLLDVSPQDRADCVSVVRFADDVLVRRVSDAITRQWGLYRQAPPHTGVNDENVWLAAYLTLAPTVAQRYRDLGVPEIVIHATLADLGRQLRVHRHHHGHFGFETWDWLVPHFTGMMFALGRFNFALHRTELDVPGTLTKNDWVIGLHIPESGPMSATSVDESLRAASEFFPRHFHGAGVQWAVCQSWLLDPFIVDHLPNSNIAAFSRRFSHVAPPDEDISEALYFIFRDRDVECVRRAHVRDRMTRLQRLVVDRALDGDPWRVPTGVVPLAPATAAVAEASTVGAGWCHLAPRTPPAR